MQMELLNNSILYPRRMRQSVCVAQISQFPSFFLFSSRLSPFLSPSPFFSPSYRLFAVAKPAYPSIWPFSFFRPRQQEWSEHKGGREPSKPTRFNTPLYLAAHLNPQSTEQDNSRLRSLDRYHEVCGEVLATRLRSRAGGRRHKKNTAVCSRGETAIILLIYPSY